MQVYVYQRKNSLMYYSILYIKLFKIRVLSDVIDYLWESLPSVDIFQKFIRIKPFFVKQISRRLFDKHWHVSNCDLLRFFITIGSLRMWYYYTY